MDPQLEKAMSVTAPQREKAAEVVAQYWVKIDYAVMKPAGEVCLVCVCVCVFFVCILRNCMLPPRPCRLADGFHCSDDCVMYTVGVASV